MASQRIRRELKMHNDFCFSNIFASPIDDTLLAWRAVIFGKKNTPLQETGHEFMIIIPQDYPFKPPKVYSKTLLAHDNLNHYNQFITTYLTTRWNPTHGVRDVLLYIQDLMCSPEEPLCDSDDISELFAQLSHNQDYNAFLDHDW